MQITKIRFGLWQSTNSGGLPIPQTGYVKSRPWLPQRANEAVLALANPFISLLFLSVRNPSGQL